MAMSIFRKLSSLWYICLISGLLLSFNEPLHAACNNIRTWQADTGTTIWNTNNNWNPRNYPNSANESAFIVSDWTIPELPASNLNVSCFEINSGFVTVQDYTLNIRGDYFKNVNSGSLLGTTGSNFRIHMRGTEPQTLENIDPIPRLRINNSTSVISTLPFVITNNLVIVDGSGTFTIQADLEVQQNSAVVIPPSATVIVDAGVELKLQGGITVNGTLRLLPGSKLTIGNGETLLVNSTGILQISGTSGNAVVIDSYNSSSTYSFDMAGTLDAEYFSISRMTGAGINITGSISDLSKGSFHYIPNGGYAMTLGATSNLPTSLPTLGFYGEAATTPRNINATSYSGSTIVMNNWSGFDGPSNETDPNNKINWGTEADPQILLTNYSPAGAPPATIAAGAGYTHFGTFAFSLSSASTASDITSIKFTVVGNYNNSDIAGAIIFKDDGNCILDGGDSLVGGISIPTGTPGTFTTNFAPGELRIDGPTPRCIYVGLSTTSSAQVNNTIGLSINSTDDVINSENYNFSTTSAPPVAPGTAIITGGNLKKWNGGSSSGNNGNMYTNNNWTSNGVPAATDDVEIGNGYSQPRMNANFTSNNLSLINGGLINWANSNNTYFLTGALTVGPSFTFMSSTNGNFNFNGSGPQSIKLSGNTFPGNVTVSNSTGPVTFDNSGTISGTLNINNGIVRIASGAVLTVGGNITVASGATLDIEPGATLVLSNGRSLTVNAGGTLSMIGSAGLNSNIQAVNNASSYTVVINGTIQARYYSFSNLGTNGVTINSGATIDATYHLQNGTFTYPGVNNVRMLRLFRQVPTNTLDNMVFDQGASGATGVRSIQTNTGAGTLTVSNYSGNLSGPGTDISVGYIVSWGTAVNTLDITLQSSAPATVNQGELIRAGSFRLVQSNPGAFNDTNITYVRVNLTGSGSASDVDSASLYYDPGCAGSGGTLLGTQTFSGNPARAVFSSISGASVPAHATSPPSRCFYVEYSISSLATNNATVGAEITSNLHIENSEGYAFNGAASPPINMGTTTIIGNTTQWTGNSSTNWFTNGNWTSGVPNSTINCIINDAARDPVIGSGTAVCKSITIGNGTVTMTGGQMQIYGSFENTGTFIQNNRNLTIRDNGITATSQSINTSSDFDNLLFNKTAGGSVAISGSSITVNSNLNFSAGNNFTFFVNSSKILVAPAGITLTSGNLQIQNKGTVQIGAGQTFNINGGTLITNGINDAYPQSLTNKAKITRVGGSGTWGFNATSGNVSLVGFNVEWINTNGLNFSGTTNINAFNGGQLNNLPSSAGMRAIQFNNSGALPSVAANVGWNWGPNNSVPNEATTYYLGASTGCGSRTISFDQWFGDFWPYTNVTTDDKITEANCDIVIDKANSPVSLTEFKATPYNEKVVIEWITGLEWYHKGFNVYRSLSPAEGFTQINQELIRNDFFSTTIHGTYAFVDSDVDNDVTYYYMLEDISTMGERTLHGPLSATPQSILGNPPPPVAQTIVSNNPDGSQSSGGDSSDDATPGLTELEPNVTLLAKTANSYRIKITIPAHTLTADSDYPTYQRASIPLYSSTLEAGKPELLDRTIMLKIPQASTAQLQVVSTMDQNFNGILMAPAPDWVLNGGNYEYQWYLDTVAYNENQMAPTTPITLGAVTNNQGQHYLPIVVHALAYNPAAQQLKKYNEIILDIFLNDNTDWAPQTPVNLSEVWSTEGALKIGIHSDGVYELTYEQMAAAGVLGPFDGGNLDKFKLYFLNQEQPLDVSSGDNLFSPGDKIRFYVKHIESLISKNNYVLLVPDYASSGNGLRMNEVDISSLFNQPTTKPGFARSVRTEQDNVALFNEPFEEHHDHFVWGLFYGVSGGATSPLSTDIDLPSLFNAGTVQIQSLVKKRKTLANNYESHLKLYVNDLAIPGAEFSFSNTEPTLATFEVDASYFVAGKNKITIEPTGFHLVTGDYDMVYIDYIDVKYTQAWWTDEDQLLVTNSEYNSDIQVDGFSSNNIFVYNVSTPGQTEKWINPNIASIGVNYSLQIPISAHGRRLWISTESKLLQPASLQLNYGSNLKQTNNEADVLYIGHEALLDAIEQLANFRESQGYKTRLVSLASIYNEFGLGVPSADNIRNFISYAHNHWSVKPQYIVLLGDGTYDPKGLQNNVIPYQFPVKLLMGSSFDYGSDHWYVTEEGQSVPFAVVGRIPARTPAELIKYANKVIAFEQKSNSYQSPSMHILSDSPQFDGENFDAFSLQLKNNISTWNPQVPVTNFSRNDLGDVDFKNKIIDSFSSAAIIHYMGHGAESMWADNSIFNTTDVETLNNTKLPVVTAMNCLNAHFYDPNITSLAEKLVLKANGGAIAFWGSTSISPPSVQAVYQKTFYEQLFKSSQHIGDAIRISKIQANQQAPYQEVMQSWTIIGDPMVTLTIPEKPIVRDPAAQAPALVAPSKNSSGCSLGAAYSDKSQPAPWDLALALLLEMLFGLAVIRVGTKLLSK